MSKVSRRLIPVALIALAAGLGPGAAQAAGDAGFGRFCSEWMDKLAQRERHNIAKLRWEQRGPVLVARYTGYGREPIRCEPTSTVVPGRPSAGKLVYREILYQKAGETPASAQRSQPAVLQTTEVMEVFRFDGRRWTY